MRRSLIALLLAMAMLAALVSGCASAPAEPAASEAPAESEAPAAEAPAQETEAPAPEAPVEETPAEPVEVEPYVYDLPLTDSTATFTHWGEGAPPFLTPYLGAEQSFNSAEATAYMEELTGVRVEFTEVDMFSKAEKFNLMIASEDYTDMVVGLDSMYSGGTAQALLDEVIVDLTEYVEGGMPAYNQVIDAGGYRKSLLSDNSEYLYVTGFDDTVYAGAGPAIRQDWLDELGLEIPETYDEWYDVGTAFKNAYDCTMAFYFTSSLNPGAWFSGGMDVPTFDVTSTGTGFFQIDGAVQSAYVQDNTKELIKLISKWYDEGLIGKDFINREMGQDCESDLFAGQVGIYWGQANFITEYNALPENEATGFHVVGMPIVKSEKDQITHFSTAESNGSGRNTICITTNCEDVDLLTTFLDFQFTEAGQLLNNYGMEGHSYYIDDAGEPQWTDEMFNTEGMSFMQMSGTWVMNGMPSLFDADRRDKVSLDEDALTARELYNQGFDGAYDMPYGMTFNEEETYQFYNRISDVDTYASEFLLKCVFGEYDVDAQWDDYVEKLYELGLQDCIDAKQTAYDRFVAR